MLNTLLIVHIVTLSISLIATISLTLATFLSVKVSKQLRIGLLVTTIVGIISGALLLVSAPLGARCLALTAYIGVFSLAYRYISIVSLRPAKLANR